MFRGSVNIPKRKQRPSAFAFVAFAEKEPAFPCVFQRGPQPRSTTTCAPPPLPLGWRSPPARHTGAPAFSPSSSCLRCTPRAALDHPAQPEPPAPCTWLHRQMTPHLCLCSVSYPHAMRPTEGAPASADLHARVDAGTHDSSAASHPACWVRGFPAAGLGGARPAGSI